MNAILNFFLTKRLLYFTSAEDILSERLNQAKYVSLEIGTYGRKWAPDLKVQRGSSMSGGQMLLLIRTAYLCQSE